ncbi:hypothetical protein BEH94_10310 [Candidatus Altiarchaeales archaeon WOR_SM1_SCG]|nr:hypothetical protein BEH94_10310 [Candidatus Altiarchaeales archaeon WOR_SM1_SCG]
MCEYKFRNGRKCEEEAFEKSKYCILHIELPEAEGSEEFKRINELKEEKVKKKVKDKDFNFDGARLFEVDFSGMEIEGDLNFQYADIRKNALFRGTNISRGVWFERANISGKASFERANIGGFSWFKGANLGGGISFERANIGGGISFEETNIKGCAWFKGINIRGDAWFERASIKEYASFEGLKIKGKLIFKDTKFKIPKTQEEACRKAKIICEKLRDQEEADYYFYREMEAKRKQKNTIIRTLELPVQYIFGYGTYWWGVLILWFSVVFGCAFLYWQGNAVVGASSFQECVYFSIVTITTLGYGDYEPVKGIYQLLAASEAVFGTFMWAAFIAIFARKYMR